MDSNFEYSDEVVSAPQMAQVDDAVRDAFARWRHDMKASGRPVSQEVIGRRLGWDQSQVSKYLRGTLDADLERVVLICQMMHTTVDAVLAGQQPPLPAGLQEWLTAGEILSREDREYLLRLAWRLARSGSGGQ